MTLKSRFTIYFSILFSGILGLVLFVIYSLFADFRQEEFRDRLEEKAETSIKLLTEVQEVDYQLLKIIDKNTITRLYNEKTLIFDEDMQLIYSSLDDAVINWNKKDLQDLKRKKHIYKKENDYDIYGLFYDSNEKDYYALIKAEDKYGNRKLTFLAYLLTISFFIGIIAIWTLSHYLSKRGLEPLDRVNQKIQEITDQNLKIRLEEGNKNDEITTLSNSFNEMMNRIDHAYNKQKEFTGNASHELRTPISRIASQLENILNSHELTEKTKAVLRSITQDIYQLSDVVTSLLLLSKIDSPKATKNLQKVRLDEIIFESIKYIKKWHSDLKFQFEIENLTKNDTDIEIPCDESLLRIAFNNLFKNAYIYSDNKVIHCVVKQTSESIFVIITNTGPSPEGKDLSSLFEAFNRGSNTKDIPGSGLGLRIVQRIFSYHNAHISFQVPEKRVNRLVVSF